MGNQNILTRPGKGKGLMHLEEKLCKLYELSNLKITFRLDEAVVYGRLHREISR